MHPAVSARRETIGRRVYKFEVSNMVVQTADTHYTRSRLRDTNRQPTTTIATPWYYRDRHRTEIEPKTCGRDCYIKNTYYILNAYA